MRPRHVLTPDADGGWGPVWLGRAATTSSPSSAGARIHHFYYEPFVRSDDLVRLLTSNPGEGWTS